MPKKLTVLFGAGASYGCGYSDISKRPPLGYQLFDELVKEYPNSWGKYVPADLKEIFRSDFELGMAHMWESQPQYFSHLRPRDCIIVCVNGQSLN
jgi:hypothetical protein